MTKKNIPMISVAPLALTTAVLSTVGVSFAQAQTSSGDAEAGERAFRQCASCHSTEPDQNRAGPHLAEIIGRQAGTVEGFRYSTAMQNSGIVWTAETLPEYLLDPSGTMPGTSMTMGLRRDSELADLLAYLATLSSESGDGAAR
ncbi:cytochrome c family protein [uncultured Roseobacter sp.]|uniref:c-type cytochrome n=1 Tax=uncultured Roseobacter sp. TaxID=114847 RepID=UPI00262C5245|nr:cytochrome c family protein [uncultured Roseobacter sp.]